MAKRTRSGTSIPFLVFAVLLLAIVGFHLQKQQGSDSVLGMTSGAPIFSKEWFAEILSFFGFGQKREAAPVEYSLPSYNGNQTSSGGFGQSPQTTGNAQADSLLVELEVTSDDGGEVEFMQLEKEASGL